MTGEPSPAGQSPGAARWEAWALAVLGGNRRSAAAAAQAACEVQARGGSPDEAAEAARAAYEQQHLQPGPAPAAPSTEPARPVGGPAVTVRPSGKLHLAALFLTAIVVGGLRVWNRYGFGDLLVDAVVFLPALGLAYAVSVRSAVMVSGDTAQFRGWFRRRTLPIAGIREICIRRDDPWWRASFAPSRRRTFVASVVGEDMSTLFNLYQGAWTRRDIDRIGLSLGVHVYDEPS